MDLVAISKALELSRGLPTIHSETLDEILTTADTPEALDAFEDAVSSLQSLQTSQIVDLVDVISSSNFSDESCESLWNAIELALGCEGSASPFQVLLTAIHLALDHSSEKVVPRALSAASLYLVLLRCTGARSHGLCNILTFNKALNVIAASILPRQQQASSSLRGKTTSSGRSRRKRAQSDCDDRDDHDDGDDMDDDGIPSGGLTVTRALSELRASLEGLPLVNGEDEELLLRTLEVVTSALTNPSLASEARATLLRLVQSSPTGVTHTATLLMKSLMPLLLCASKAKSVPSAGTKTARNEALKVVQEMLSLLSESDDDDSNALAHSFLVLIEHLCHRAPEKAETRATVVEAVDVILKQLPAKEQRRFASFASKFSRSAKVNHRVFAVDLIAEIVKSAWLWETVDADDGDDVSTAERLLALLLSRGSDKAPTVRSRAMGALCALISASKDGQLTAPPLRKALAKRHHAVTPHTGMNTPPVAGPTPSSSSSSSVEGGKVIDVRALLSRRLEDDRAVVRRAAAQAIAAVIELNVTQAREQGNMSSDSEACDAWESEVLKLRSLCADVSVATRKAAATAITSLLLLLPASSLLQSAFTEVVLPLAHDNEASVQHRCSELVREAMLDRVRNWHESISSQTVPLAESFHSLWSLIAKAESTEAQKCLQSALWPSASTASSTTAVSFVWGAAVMEKLLSALRSAALMVCTDDSDDGDDGLSMTGPQRRTLRQGTWVLFEAILCPSMERKDPSTSGTTPVEAGFVLKCWRDCWNELDAIEEREASGSLASEDSRERAVLEVNAQRILRVMARLAPAIPAADATTLAAEILGLLQNLPGSVVTSAAMVKSLVALCSAKAPDVDAAQEMCLSWADALLSGCQSTLSQFVYPDHTSPPLVLVERSLHLVGELCMLAFSADDNGTNSDGPGGRALSLHVPDELVSLVEVLIAHRLPTSGSSDGGDGGDDGDDGDAAMEVEGEIVPDSARAFAFVTLGKFCLLDSSLAKDTANVFVRELQTSTAPAVQSNVLLVLGDLCVRYTSLVERHLPAMAACIQSGHGLVRRHALLLLAQLLLQDYLKWRGLLLHRFLLATTDSDPEVASVAKYLVSGPLLSKQSALLSQAFAELPFVLNSHEEHPRYRAAACHGGEAGIAVTWEGVDLTDREATRMDVYRFVLACLSDEQRIDVTAKLAHDVLAGYADEERPSSASSSRSSASSLAIVGGVDERVVRDILAVLRMPELRVGRSSGSNQMPDEELLNTASAEGLNAAAKAGLDAAKGKLLSKMSKKQLIDHILPILLGLKHRLEAIHSPLLKDLMQYFCEMVRSYRTEVKAVLATEPTFAKELEYDIKMFEREALQKQKQMQRQAALDAAERATQIAVSGNPRTPRSSRKKHSSTSGMKSAKSTGSIATPKLKDARTPREARLSRTPADAMRAALSNQKSRSTPSIQHTTDAHPTASSDSSPGAMSPVPFRMPPEATPSATKPAKRQWSVTLVGNENAKPTNGSPASHGSSPSTSTISSTSPSTSSPGKPDKASSRPPDHRTPHGKKKKKRTTFRLERSSP